MILPGVGHMPNLEAAGALRRGRPRVRHGGSLTAAVRHRVSSIIDRPTNPGGGFLTSISRHESALAATNVARRSYASWLTTCRESVEVATRYWAGAAARCATPFDVAADGARWARLVSDRRPPDWSSPNDIVESSPLSVLRRFGSARRGRPLLVLPPQAGHHSCVVDYSPSRARCGRLSRPVYRQVHVLEWLGATEETKGARSRTTSASSRRRSSGSEARSTSSETARAAGSRRSTPRSTPQTSRR